MRRKISGLLNKVRRYNYLLGKLFGEPGKNIVIYTKKHPIYTSIFEETRFDQYKFVYLQFDKKFSYLEQHIFNKARILHFDGAHFNTRHVADKIMVVEYEGMPTKEALTSNLVKRVYIESKAAAAGLTGEYPKLKLLYPTIKVRDTIEFKERGANNPIVLTAVGYGGLIKGFDVIYKIYETLKKKYPVKLIIAGTFGHNYQWYPEITEEAYDRAGFPLIQEKIQADPDVRMGPAKRDDLFADIYPRTDIYLHFSRMETFGYSILEAMSFGLPVVASKFRAIPEMVENNVNGFLINDFEDDINSEEWFNKSYAEGLAAVTRLIEDDSLRKEMGRKSYDKIKTTFNTENKKAFIEAEYNLLLQ